MQDRTLNNTNPVRDSCLELIVGFNAFVIDRENKNQLGVTSYWIPFSAASVVNLSQILPHSSKSIRYQMGS